MRVIVVARSKPPSDQVILLHHGSVLRAGRAEHVLAETGAASMADAFMTLTREAA